MESEYINDNLNLRGLIDQINEFARNNNIKNYYAPKNARSFFLILFDGITASNGAVGTKKVNNDGMDTNTGKESPKEESLLLYAQKLLSGNIPIDSLSSFSATLLEKSAMDKMYSNISPIIDAFVAIPDCYSFFQRLSQQISPRFFQLDEINNLLSSLNNCDYKKFLFDLIIHGLKTLYNIPAYFCERLLEEALSYGYDSPVRYELMRLASDSNKRAALEYGKFLSKNGPYDQAFRYMIKAVPMPAAIWNIAFLIENHKLSREEVNQFKSTIHFDDTIVNVANAAFPEMSDIICVVKVPAYDDLVCAYKTYAFLAIKCLFFKGFNSMAKLLGTKSFAIREGSSYKKGKLIDSYRRHAVEGSNPTALNNVGAALMNRVENGDIETRDVYEQDLLQECLRNAADCGMAYSAFRLARYMEYYSAPQEEIIAQYHKALKLDVDKDIHGSILISLGNLEKNPDKRIEYFKQALEEHDYSSIVYLATEYSEKVHMSDYPEYWIKELRLLGNRYDSLIDDNSRSKILQLTDEAEAWFAAHALTTDISSS